MWIVAVVVVVGRFRWDMYRFMSLATLAELHAVGEEATWKAQRERCSRADTEERLRLAKAEIKAKLKMNIIEHLYTR